MNAPLTLAQVAASWMQAKEAERQAIEYRRSLDKMMVELLPKKDEGSVTEKDGNYKITASYKLDRKVDSAKLAEIWGDLDEHAQKAFKWKADVAVSELRKVQEFEPDVYAKLAECITTKPASTAVSVELL